MNRSRLIALAAAAMAAAALLAPASLGAQTSIRVLAEVHAWTKDLNDIPYLQRAAAAAGLKVDWEQVRAGWDEKKSVVLASGDLPDAFLSGLTDQDIILNADNFVDLAPLVDKYAPNIKKMFQEMPDAKRISVFPDGKLYSLPAVRPFRPDSFNVMLINQKWLTKLGMKAPTTLDELYKVLAAFKAKDPNGNGKADEIPLDWWAGAGSNAGSRGLFSVLSLLGAYGIVDDFSNDLVAAKDGKVTFLFARDEYKELVKFLNKCWAAGLINPEVFTQDYSSMMAKAQRPDASTVGVTFGWTATDRMAKWADDYAVLPPVAAKPGMKPLWPTNVARVKMGTNAVAITKANKHPVETIKWIDQLYSEESSIQGYYGSIPEFVKSVDNGKKYEIVPAADGNQDRQMWTNALVDFDPLYSSAALEAKTTVPPSVVRRMKEDSVYKKYQPDPKSIYPIVKFSSADIDQMALAKTDVYKYVDQKFAEWILKGTVEQDWAGYLAQLKLMGLPTMEKLYQKAYENYYK
jgi:putative aldouronate transport system substrate-binding protein